MPIDLFVGEPNSILFYHANSIPIDLVVGEPNHPLHGHLLPHSAHLLLAVGQRGEGGDRDLRHQHCFRHHYHRHHIYQKGGCSNILYYKVLLRNTYFHWVM